MKRPDWEKIIKIPFGMLPLGSGNAVAVSTLTEAKYVLPINRVVLKS